MDYQIKFWMVYGLERSLPTYRHISKASAQREAQRLAEQAPGETFVVLAVTDAYRAKVEPVARLAVQVADPDEIIPW